MKTRIYAAPAVKGLKDIGLSDIFIPAVRLTCIACFSPISQSILNRFLRNVARTIFESRGDYREISVKKYYIVQKLDHLTCSKL